MQPSPTKPIFIGGTGRCGTTILKRILRRHPQIFGLLSEGRFITDPDGLLDLADAHSTQFSGEGSDKALRRFEHLMQSLRKTSAGYRAARRVGRWLGVDLFSLISPSEYAAYDVGRQFGLEHFDRTVADLLRQLEAFRYPGILPSTPPYRFRPHIIRGRYFDRAEILEMCRRFTHNLYSQRLLEQDKTRWVEDTPGNMLHALRLQEMFPDMKLVHVFRDPRDVVASHATKRWSPSDHTKTVRAVADFISVWLDIRDGLRPANVFLLRFEDFIAAPADVLGRLCDFLELPFESAMLDIDLSRHNIGRYRKHLSPDVIATIEKLLAKWMDENGYLGVETRATAPVVATT
jgi:hypothetical protein